MFCGAKCKRKLAKATAKKKNFAGQNFLNADGSTNMANYELDTTKLWSLLKNNPIDELVHKENQNQEFHNVEPVSTATAVMVGLGGAVISGLAAYLSSVPQNKALKEQVKNQKIKDDKELKLMAKQQDISKEQAKNNSNLRK